MSVVGQISEQKDRPPYIRFKRDAVEDAQASLEAGHYVARDVDYVLVTPPYSQKDVLRFKVASWFETLEVDVRNGRFPAEWLDKFRGSYALWKNGQEIPLDGTPIRGWGVISPAQQETLTRMMILTVEDLSRANDDALRKIGMGAVELRNKARAWLAQVNDKGPATLQIANLQKENEILSSSVSALQKQVEELCRQLKFAPALSEPQVAPDPHEIPASAIFDEVEPVKRGPGRPKKT